MIRRSLRKRTIYDAAFQHQHFEPPAQRSKLSTWSSSKNLIDMPAEILLQIVQYIPIWHRKNVRLSCKLLRDITDHVVYRDARQVMETTGDRLPYEKAMITTVYHLVYVYYKSELVQFVPGALLSLWRQNFNCPFAPSFENFKQFVFTTYSELIVTLDWNVFRAAFVSTLLLLLSRNEICQCQSEYEGDSCVELNYFMPGCFLGIVYASNTVGRGLTFPEDGAFVWTFLGDMLQMALNQRRTYKNCLLDTDDKLYMYGRDVTNRKSPAYTNGTHIRMSLHGSAECLRIVRQAVDPLVPLRFDDFAVGFEGFGCLVKICSKEAQKKGCLRDNFMYI